MTGLPEEHHAIANEIKRRINERLLDGPFNIMRSDKLEALFVEVCAEMNRPDIIVEYNGVTNRLDVLIPYPGNT
jgi:hypothetical protein